MVLRRVALHCGLGLLLWSGCGFYSATPVHPLEVGEIEFDPSTFHTIGLSLPIRSGDEDFDAFVAVFYRPVGSPAWKEALPLQRVRTDTLSHPVPSPFPVGEQFAGSVFGLEPDRAYEIKLEIADPDGPRLTKVKVVRTRKLPPEEVAPVRAISVRSGPEFTQALSDARPGDVIELSDGEYSGPFSLIRSGTEKAPIVLRGRTRSGAVLSSSADYTLSIGGSHVIVEQLTITGRAWAMRITNATDVTVRRTRIEGVQYGINASGGANRNFTICDNRLAGTGVTWPDHSSKTWNFEGIVVTGTGHVICHNTVEGFGDALGLSQHTAIPNRAIDFYGNDVLWGGDDGIELDFSERNVRAWDNRFGNVGMGISFQPIWGGPVYVFRNVIYNTAHAPYKLNQEPSGFHIMHNTAIRPGAAWNQYGGRVSNFSFFNNLTIGTEHAVYMQPALHGAQIDYNGWAPDGKFTMNAKWQDFAELHSGSPFENHGVLLKHPIFARPVPVPKDPSSRMSVPEALELDGKSNAVDAGVRLPNINDDFTGRAPDLGAVERGVPPPQYGVRGERHERTVFSR